MRSSGTNAGRLALRFALTAALAAATAIFFSGDAEARGKYKVAKHGHHPPHSVPVVVVSAPIRPVAVMRPFVVPTRIVHQDVRTFAPYRYGTVWVPEHRHSHVVYRFPVATPYGVTYQSHAYCDGSRVVIPVVPVVHDDRPHGFVSFGNGNVHFGIGF